MGLCGSRGKLAEAERLADQAAVILRAVFGEQHPEYAHSLNFRGWVQRSKGNLAPGFDADIVLVETDVSDTIRARDSKSAQGYTPFEGIELSARVATTLLRGEVIYDRGEIIGPPRGQYLHRPCG